MTVYHVAIHGSDDHDGSAATPLRTINRGAALARPGDTVRVHAGEHREWVTPVRGGLGDRRRITYEAAPGARPPERRHPGPHHCPDRLETP